jgi:O-antigen/teichoic acid export membrane protein
MLKSLRKIIFEKNFVSLFTSLITAGIGLVSFLLLTRGLEKELFGDWVLFITISTFFDQLRFGLTSTALVRFLSGSSKEKQEIYLGTSYKIGLITVFGIVGVLWILSAIVHSFGWSINNGYLLFLKWYPVLALLNLSWNNAISYFQSKQDFKQILFIRLLNVGLFVVFLIVNNLFLRCELEYIVFAYLAVNLIPTVLSIIKKWDGLFFIKKADSSSTREMLNFGKFSMGTLIGSNLLKSADTFIIGLSPFLGSVGIAQYAIPLKLTDLLGIPLRSFTITSFPRMAKKSLDGNIDGLKKIFYGYSSVITVLFIPVAIFGVIFAEPMVLFLGGNQFKDSLPLLATIFRIFSLYSILLPLDRFTGIALDSINRPKLNFYKVIVMTLANIIGDIIAVFVFKSLEAVAAVTVLFTFIGIFIGYYYLNREIKLNVKSLISEGYLFFKNMKSYF